MQKTPSVITQLQFAALTRTIELRIHWADRACVDADLLPQALQDVPAFRKLQHTLRGALDTLVHFASLRRVNITWSPPSEVVDGGPSKAKCRAAASVEDAARGEPGGGDLYAGGRGDIECGTGEEAGEGGEDLWLSEALSEISETVEDTVYSLEEQMNAITRFEATLGLG